MIDNVYVFSAESLRFDFFRDYLLDEVGGVVFRGVSQAPQTGAALASMVTGLNPPRHGVGSLEHLVSGGSRVKVESLLDLEGYHSYFASHEGGVASYCFNREGDVGGVVEEVEEPFVVVDEGFVSHYPYVSGLGASDVEYRDAVNRGERSVVEDYAVGVEGLMERYRYVVEVLGERGLLRNTLVVFVGDHGEFLGENGYFAHCRPIHPVLVYVPVVFVHSSLGEGVRDVAVRQVDILPTVLGLLGREWVREVEGVDVFGSGVDFGEEVLVGFNHIVFEKFRYRESSVWMGQGGYVEEEGRVDKFRAAPENQVYRWVKGERVEGDMDRDRGREWVKRFGEGPWKGVVPRRDLE